MGQRKYLVLEGHVKGHEYGIFKTRNTIGRIILQSICGIFVLNYRYMEF